MVVICRPSVFRSCSLMPGRRQFLQHLVLDQALRPAPSAAVSTWASGSTSGNCMAARSAAIERAAVDHAVEHVVPTRLGAGRDWSRDRGSDGCWIDAASTRALGDRQLVDRLAEVRLRRGRDAVRAATEVDGVEVRGQDVVLGPLRAIFDEITSSRILRVSERSDPTSAFFTYCWVMVEPPPALSLPSTLSRAARAKPRDRESGVGVEVAVLGREHRVAHVLRDLVDRDLGAVALRRHDGAITVVPSAARIVAT